MTVRLLKYKKNKETVVIYQNKKKTATRYLKQDRKTPKRGRMDRIGEDCDGL